MSLSRLIPTIVLDGHRAVKTFQYANPIYLGDPVNIIRQLSEKSNVDEILIVNPFERISDDYLLRSMSRASRIPLTYVGGVRSIEQAKKILRLGFEKVGLSKLIYTNPELVREMVKSLGSSSIVGLISYDKSLNGRKAFYGNRINSEVTFEEKEISEIVFKCNEIGLGEIILNNAQADGMRTGLDTDILSSNFSDCSSSIVLGCGFTDLSDFFDLKSLGVSVACSSYCFLHKNQSGIICWYPKALFNAL